MKSMNLFSDSSEDVVDLRYLDWEVSKISPGTPGMFLKSYEQIDNELYYYKMSNFDSARGFFGHESLNEIIAKNVAKLLGIDCLEYELIPCKVNLFSKEYTTYVTKSKNFRKKGEDKMSLETFYELNHHESEPVLEFLERKGFQDVISDMFLLDWLICNRDRHGANIEVIASANSYRPAPLFDHGLSFMFSCYNSIENMKAFNPLQDLPVNNYLGSRILSENLNLVNEDTKERFFKAKFEDAVLLEGVQIALNSMPSEFSDYVIKMIKERVKYAKDFFNNQSI